jgi:hypothetical protein
VFVYCMTLHKVKETRSSSAKSRVSICMHEQMSENDKRHIDPLVKLMVHRKSRSNLQGRMHRCTGAATHEFYVQRDM